MINSTLKRAVAVAVLAGVSVGAQAADKDIGTVSLNVPTSFDGFALGGSQTSLNDIIHFNTAEATAGAGVSVIDFPLDLGAPGTLGLALATVTLGSVDSSGSMHILKSSVFSDPGNTNGHISFTYDNPLAASNYFINVTGVTNGTLGGAYSGAISLAAAVPEPETYAMLLAGLGLMGAVVRRRRQS